MKSFFVLLSFLPLVILARPGGSKDLNGTSTVRAKSAESIQESTQKCLMALNDNSPLSQSPVCKEVESTLVWLENKTEGFHLTYSQELPKAVKIASQRTYLMVIYENVSLAKEDVLILLAKTNKPAFLYDDQGIARLNGSAEALAIFLSGLNSKKENEFGDKVEIHNPISLCTAFTTNNGLKLWTDRHCIQKLQEFRKWPIVLQYNFFAGHGIALLDQYGKIVGKVNNALEMGIDPDTMPASLPEGFENLSLKEQPVDYVGLKMSYSVAPALEIAEEPTEREVVWSIGYPSTTGSGTSGYSINKRDRGMGFNADGSAKIAIGQTILRSTVESVFPLFGFNFDILNYLGPANSPYWPEARITTNDCTAGMSGAPMVNEKGQVIGIVSRCLDTKNGNKDDSKEYGTLTIITRPTEF